MGMKDLLDGQVELQINMQVQADPSLEPFKHILTEFLQKHMSYEALRPEFIKMYAVAFTASELRDINDFLLAHVFSGENWLIISGGFPLNIAVKVFLSYSVHGTETVSTLKSEILLNKSECT